MRVYVAPIVPFRMLISNAGRKIDVYMLRRTGKKPISEIVNGQWRAHHGFGLVGRYLLAALEEHGMSGSGRYLRSMSDGPFFPTVKNFIDQTLRIRHASMSPTRTERCGYGQLEATLAVPAALDAVVHKCD